jgi:hypothetical protein
MKARRIWRAFHLRMKRSKILWKEEFSKNIPGGGGATLGNQNPLGLDAFGIHAQ